MSNPVIPVSTAVESNNESSQKQINWGMAVFFLGILGFIVALISHYVPAEATSSWMITSASIVTLAAVASYIALFQTKGRKFAVWSMLIFSISSPILFFFAFMSYMM